MRLPSRFRLSLALLLTATALVAAPGEPVSAGSADSSVAENRLSAGRLRCEYLVNPLGVDEPAPRLSWEPEAPGRGERQTAYRILVASTPEALAADRGDLWDSGKINSAESAHVAYAGTPLGSRTACHWKVMLWNRDDRPSAWSAPALWTTGLLSPREWSGKWIRAERPEPAVTLVVSKAEYGATDGSVKVDVTPALVKKTGAGGLSLSVSNAALGGDPCFGKPKRLSVEYTLNGAPATLVVAEGGRLSIPEKPMAPPVLLRKTFAAGKDLRRATLYVSALGLYEMSLNGKRVGDHTLAPDWTDYRKRVRYQVYDVTPLIRSGADNVLASALGNGWYAGRIGNGHSSYWGKAPALLAQLELTRADGTIDRVVSDGSWTWHDAPILASDFMLGENHDARLELPGWNSPGSSGKAWRDVSVVAPETGPLEAQVTEPVRQIGEVPAKALAEPRPGKWTYDLGQNMVGVVRLKISAPAGTKITLRHAEMLNPDGTVYTANLRRAPSVDTYVCKGAGEEIWQPKFTFHGFRYVELTGVTARPALDAVTGVVLASDTPRTSGFECSDPRLNRLYSNIVWGQRGNYLSVPTDCPQRDERLGWMGDAQVFVRTAAYNADIAAFYTKWLRDVDDAQTPDGAFTDVSPPPVMSAGTPAWGDAGVICPWTIHQVYGDRRLLGRSLPAMIRWVEWCRAHSTGLLRDRDRGNDYGDWLSQGANTPHDVIGTAYFAYSTSLVAKACASLGKQAEAAKYERLFDDIRTAFNTAYVSADGHIRGDTQCVYLMALKFDLLPEKLRPAVAQRLEDDIRARGDHLSTGFVGVSYLLPVLTKAGKTDTAYALMTQDTFPSWLFSVKHGATTIWERWDGWTPERGFQDAGMNSFNHYSLGSCGEWMFSTIAGIDSDTPGFGHAVIRPRPGGGVTWARAHYDSIRGRISTAWKLTGDRFDLEVTVPANTTATVYVPAKDVDAVTEGGVPASRAPGVKSSKAGDGCAVFEIEAGAYRFSALRR